MTTVSPVNQRGSAPAIRKTDSYEGAAPGTWDFYRTYEAGDRSGILFLCPCGCDSLFSIAYKPYQGCGPVWNWDGNEDSPTVTPSILVYQMNAKGERIGEHWHGFLTNGEFKSC